MLELCTWGGAQTSRREWEQTAWMGYGIQVVAFQVHSKSFTVWAQNMLETIQGRLWSAPNSHSPHRSSRNATNHLLYYKSKQECEDSKSCSILIKFLDAFIQDIFPVIRFFFLPLSEQVCTVLALHISLVQTDFPFFCPRGLEPAGQVRASGAVQSSVRAIAWSLLSTILSQNKRRLKERRRDGRGFPLLPQNILGSVPHQDLLQAESIYRVWCG